MIISIPDSEILEHLPELNRLVFDVLIEIKREGASEDEERGEEESQSRK